MKTIGKFADRLLGVVVPQSSAAAACAPDNECWMWNQPGTCRCMRTFMYNGTCRTEIYYTRGCY
ncbi:hypothetical protein KZ829_26230 [Actinoplanes hulinensis]|uniref:Uncharacterized protein n=1 Tax=Actinoplanes hulinensis TaxID=1144547 RepID=A0ABS7B8E4_9ACTN|nr:hypothetical protein [Actinoplanes hulinensis]MBW6437238.1 hypothetical protein [Actinoplanes hulinensis]